MAAIGLDLVTAAVVGAAGQLLGPVVRDVLARQSSGRRQARIAKINAEAAEMSRLRDQPSAATAYVGMLMLKTVIPSALAAILSTVTVLLPAGQAGHPSTDQYLAGAAAFVTLAFGAFAASRAVGSCRAIYDPPWYAARLGKRLRRLEDASAPLVRVVLEMHPEPGQEQEQEPDQAATSGPALPGPGPASATRGRVPPVNSRTGSRPERTNLPEP